MEIFTNVFTYFSNAFIVLYFYLQCYFWYIIMGVFFAVIVGIEFHEKQFLFIDDERKVV